MAPLKNPRVSVADATRNEAKVVAGMAEPAEAVA